VAALTLDGLEADKTSIDAFAFAGREAEA